MEDNRCLNMDDFKKYMNSYINATNMTTKDYMTIIFYMNHIRSCERCEKIEDNLITIMESSSSEEEFWERFHEYWIEQDEADRHVVDLFSIDLIKKEISNRIEKIPEWLNENFKKSTSVLELFTASFVNGGALAGLTRGDDTHDIGSNITINYIKEESILQLTTDLDITKGKIYLIDEANNKTYEADVIDEGYMEFHNVNADKITVKLAL